MKKISKIQLNAMKDEFPVLSEQTMRIIVGGTDNLCVLDAMVMASACAGYSYTSSDIRAGIIDHLMISRGLSEGDAGDLLDNNGLNGIDTSAVIYKFFGGGGVNSGSATAGACNIITFQTEEKDNKGNYIYHAGRLDGIAGNDCIITDGNGNTFLVDKNKLGLMFDISTIDGSGGGSGGGSGNGSANGSGSGSGNGWY
ncbi:MAG: TIGR04149 family rSAM-modified RiPP [Bacteroidales bacterium]|jgi:natural product precursor|nr:TIGR04149 family rSAM-modified RiPP [Bacteroidales bacterium]